MAEGARNALVAAKAALPSVPPAPMFSVEPSVPASVSELFTASVLPAPTVTGLPVRFAQGNEPVVTAPSVVMLVEPASGE